MPVDYQTFINGQMAASHNLVLWAYPTDHPLEAILSPGYFNGAGHLLAGMGDYHWIMLVKQGIILNAVCDKRTRHVQVTVVGPSQVGDGRGVDREPPSGAPMDSAFADLVNA